MTAAADPKIRAAEAAGLEFPWRERPAFGQTREVAPGVHWARLRLPMALDHVNVYLLDEGDGSFTLVDTGMDTEENRAAWTELLKGKRVRRVIVTHQHPDHIGLAGWICKNWRAPMLTSRTSYLYGRMLQLDTMDPLPEAAERYYLEAGFSAEQMAIIRQRVRGGYYKTHPTPFDFHRLAAGDSLNIGGRTWRVWMGEGHAPEHVCLWSAADGLFLSADQLLPRISSVVGVFPAEPDADPITEFVATCARIRDEIPNEALILCGHNEPFKGAARRAAQLLVHHEARLMAMREAARTPQTLVELFPSIFDRKIVPETLGFAVMEARAHANHLMKRGLLAPEAPDAAGAARWRAL